MAIKARITNFEQKFNEKNNTGIYSFFFKGSCLHRTNKNLLKPENG